MKDDNEIFKIIVTRKELQEIIFCLEQMYSELYDDMNNLEYKDDDEDRMKIADARVMIAALSDKFTLLLDD